MIKNLSKIEHEIWMDFLHQTFQIQNNYTFQLKTNDFTKNVKPLNKTKSRTGHSHYGS